MENKTARRIVLSGLICIIFTVAAFYIWLPPINGYAPEFWTFLGAVTVSFFLPYFLLGGIRKIKIDRTGINYNGEKPSLKKKSVPLIIFICIMAVIIALVFGGTLISSTVFNAKKYANDIIEVQEAVFSEDMKDTEKINNIALMDSDSAKKFGDKALGELEEVVSQYVAGENYTQINYKGLPKKVTSLEYESFFKWFSNRESGIPGYIMVNPIGSFGAEYVKLDTPMKYAESGYFSDDLLRKLRFDYPTKIFDYVSYEIDEEGKPYYIVACSKPQIFPFGGYDVEEVIVFDPCTGESEIMSVDATPSWIDIVYSGDLAAKKYDWYGTLAGGFFNSIIGNKGCKITTDDYGYITIGDDVWYYTGVTSVTSDSSNIGFIITNARTGEYKYYPCGGADEHTAMGAAEGEVQETGYEASFPSLINVSGHATYIMVLKDAKGTVKLYALVNVQKYSIVVTAQTQEEVMKKYKELLVQNDLVGEDALPEEYQATIEISEIKNVVISGDSVVYLGSTSGVMYKGRLADFEELILLSVGDTINVKYADTEIDGIKQIVSFEIVK